MVVAGVPRRLSDEAIAETLQMMADVERLRGPLRISAMKTADGLGILIPPARRYATIVLMVLWFVVMTFGTFVAGGRFLVGLLAGKPEWAILIWLVPWTLVSLLPLVVALSQLLRSERLFFTADALVRERRFAGFASRQIVHGSDIVEVSVEASQHNDPLGRGSVKIITRQGASRVGNGLDFREAEIVARLIRFAAGADSGTAVAP